MDKEATSSEITDHNLKALTNDKLNQALLDCLPYPAVLIRQDRVLIAANKIAKEIGAKLGTYCWDTLGQRASISNSDGDYYKTHNSVPEGGIKCVFCSCDRAFDTATAVNKPVDVGGSSFETYWIPLGEGLLLHYFIEIED